MSLSLRRERLPIELYYGILPEILIDYLHPALTDAEPPPWNAFAVLPVVSPGFNYVCQHIFREIFGEDAEGPINFDSRRERYTRSKSLWAKTRLSPMPAWDVATDNFDPSHIPRQYTTKFETSLLAAYDHISLGLYYYRSDARYMEEAPYDCYLLLWMPYMGHSLRICDAIANKTRLACVAPLISDVICKTLALFCLKMAQGSISSLLQSISLGYGLSDIEENCIGSNLTRLKDLEETTQDFLWSGGFVSETYPLLATPTKELIIESEIIPALESIIDFDWGEDTNDIAANTAMLYKAYKARNEQV